MIENRTAIDDIHAEVQARTAPGGRPSLPGGAVRVAAFPLSAHYDRNRCRHVRHPLVGRARSVAERLILPAAPKPAGPQESRPMSTIRLCRHPPVRAIWLQRARPPARKRPTC